MYVVLGVGRRHGEAKDLWHHSVSPLPAAGIVPRKSPVTPQAASAASWGSRTPQRFVSVIEWGACEVCQSFAGLRDSGQDLVHVYSWAKHKCLLGGREGRRPSPQMPSVSSGLRS